MIVAREVEASSGSFGLPDVDGASAQNSALIVTGFTETDPEVQVQVRPRSSNSCLKSVDGEISLINYVQ